MSNLYNERGDATCTVTELQRSRTSDDFDGTQSCVRVCVNVCVCLCDTVYVLPTKNRRCEDGSPSTVRPSKSSPSNAHTHTLTEVTEGLLQLVDIDVRLHLNELLHKGVAQGILGLHEKVVREERGREGGEERGER